jgi:hypothetical protein
VIVSLLVLKGYYYPSDSDSGSSGNIVMDVYSGVELYPRLFWVSLRARTPRLTRAALPKAILR